MENPKITMATMNGTSRPQTIPAMQAMPMMQNASASTTLSSRLLVAPSLTPAFRMTTAHGHLSRLTATLRHT